MASTISNGTTTITPKLVTELAASSPSNNKKHVLLDGGLAMSIRGAGLREGALKLLFLLEADAAAAVALHRSPAVFTFADPDRPTLAMSYVLADGGSVALELDDETRALWLVTVPYQEVTR